MKQPPASAFQVDVVDSWSTSSERNPIKQLHLTMSNIPMSTPPPVLPNRGTAKVKSVLSGDTVVLLGRAGEGKKAPEVTFTFERVTAPRFV